MAVRMSVDVTGRYGNAAGEHKVLPYETRDRCKHRRGAHCASGTATWKITICPRTATGRPYKITSLRTKNPVIAGLTRNLIRQRQIPGQARNDGRLNLYSSILNVNTSKGLIFTTILPSFTSAGVSTSSSMLHTQAALTGLANSSAVSVVRLLFS